MTMTINIATTETDTDRDRIMPGALKMPKGACMIFHNFDYSKLLGIVESISEEGTNITASIRLRSDLDSIKDLIPAIGFKEIKSRHEGDIRIIEDAELVCVGLSVNENTDDRIKSIGEQLKPFSPTGPNYPSAE